MEQRLPSFDRRVSEFLLMAVLILILLSMGKAFWLALPVSLIGCVGVKSEKWIVIVLAENQALSEVDQIAHLQLCPSQPRIWLLLTRYILYYGAWQLSRCTSGSAVLVFFPCPAPSWEHPALQFIVVHLLIPCGHAEWGSERFSVCPQAAKHLGFSKLKASLVSVYLAAFPIKVDLSRLLGTLALGAATSCTSATLVKVDKCCFSPSPPGALVL